MIMCCHKTVSAIGRTASIIGLSCFLFIVLCLLIVKLFTTYNLASGAAIDTIRFWDQQSYESNTWFHEWFKRYNQSDYGIDRWSNYFFPYERHFQRWRGKSVVMLEIGVQSGGSTKMWPSYFGPGLDYYGFDINPECEKFSRPNVTILIGDQSKTEDIERLLHQIPTPDIVIDDGGHRMRQQILSFRTIFPKIKDGGIYLVEDTHTSYMPEYGGKSVSKLTQAARTMIDTAKLFVDVMNIERINPKFSFLEEWKEFNATIAGVFFYNSLIFVEKADVKPPVMVRASGQWIPFGIGANMPEKERELLQKSQGVRSSTHKTTD